MTTPKKTASKKTTSKKTTAKKTTAKKTTAKKTTAKKTASKKTTAKKTASKKTASKKTASKTTASKTTASKKTASKKTASKKTASKKTATKKTASRKTATKKIKPKPLALKLGILEGLWVIDNPPPGFELLKPPKVDIGVDLQGPLSAGQSVLAFVLDREDVGSLAAALRATLPATGEVKLWIAYPKTSSGVETDLTRDVGWEPVHGLGLRAVANVAVDDVWSALRFRPVGARR